MMRVVANSVACFRGMSAAAKCAPQGSLSLAKAIFSGMPSSVDRAPFPHSVQRRFITCRKNTVEHTVIAKLKFPDEEKIKRDVLEILGFEAFKDKYFEEKGITKLVAELAAKRLAHQELSEEGINTHALMIINDLMTGKDGMGKTIPKIDLPASMMPSLSKSLEHALLIMLNAKALLSHNKEKFRFPNEEQMMTDLCGHFPTASDHLREIFGVAVKRLANRQWSEKEIEDTAISVMSDFVQGLDSVTKKRLTKIDEAFIPLLEATDALKNILLDYVKG